MAAASDKPFGGTIGTTVAVSKPWWPLFMNVKHLVCAVVSAWLLLACFVQPIYATSALLDDFVEVSGEKVAAIIPKLPATYPGARFLISGFSSPSGKWEFVRIENTSSCEDEACPTIIVHEKVEWKILILARKQIELAIGTLNEGYVTCTFVSKGNSKIIIRYADYERVLSVVQ